MAIGHKCPLANILHILIHSLQVLKKNAGVKLEIRVVELYFTEGLVFTTNNRVNLCINKI